MAVTLKEPYDLDPLFEKVVLYYAACSPKFWSLAGHVLDHECMGLPISKVVLEVVRRIAKEVGHGPESPLIVIQRLNRLRYEGKVTQQEIVAVNDMFDEALDCVPPPMEAIAAEILPVLKRRLQSQAILLAHDEFSKKGDFTVVQSVLHKAQTLGISEQIDSIKLDASGVDEIAKVGTFERLPTGIFDLDIEIAGGLPRRQLGIWIGGPGGGKSMALTEQAAEGVRQKQLVGLATLELPRHVQLARLYANLVGMPVDNILEVPADREEVKRRIGLISGMVGACEVADFPPGATSVRDLIQWVDSVEQKHGRKMSLLVVDYADKMYAPQVRDGNEYQSGKYIYEGLRRDIAMNRDMWVWTASQATRANKESSKTIDLQHVADSMHKVRVGDMVITINPQDEEQMNKFFVAKNRMGRNRFYVGPLIRDYERARMMPVAKELMVW